jgi:hypothetical protein
MGPGLPGFGIASLFYIGAAILAPIHEVGMTLRGRSSLRRWHMALTQFAIGLGILSALVLFYSGIDHLITWGVFPTGRGIAVLAHIPNWVYAAGTLVVVLVAGAIVGAVASWISADDDPEVVAEGHRAGITGMVLDLRTERSRRERPLGPTRWYEVEWTGLLGSSNDRAASLLTCDRRHTGAEPSTVERPSHRWYEGGAREAVAAVASRDTAVPEAAMLVTAFGTTQAPRARRWYEGALHDGGLAAPRRDPADSALVPAT